MIFIAVKVPGPTGTRGGWMDLVSDFTAGTRAEPGNLFFEWSSSVEDPNEYVLLEAFRDGDTGDAHVRTDHFKTAMTTLPSAIARDTEDRERANPRRGPAPDV